MTTFDDRQKAFETKYARDQEMQFKITSRRNRLLGQWAAAKMGLSEEESERLELRRAADRGLDFVGHLQRHQVELGAE